jgi:thioredoxin 2
MSELVCANCGAVNRIPPGKPVKQAKCGKCHVALFAGHPIELDAASFDRHVSRSSIPMVIDFWADWCGPCQMMAPEFAKAAALLEPDARLAKLDTEQAQTQSAALGIRSIPTMIMFQGGKEIARQSGAMRADQIIQWVRGNLPQ